MKILFVLLFTGSLLGQSNFPAIATGGLTYLNPNTLNPNAFSYQQADYDPAHNQVLFYPYGSVSGVPLANSGVLLVYKSVSGGFANPANWVVVDLTLPSIGLSPYAWNFSGGFMDGSGSATSISATNPTYAYLTTGPRSNIPGAATRAQQGDITVQINLAALAIDPQNVHGQTYRYIDLSAVPSVTDIGGFSGVWANGSAYYCPSGSDITGKANTVLIRYNSALGAFDNQAAWQTFNLATIPVGQGTGSSPDPQLGGMQSAAYIAPNVYLIPFFNGNQATNNPPVTMASKIVAYDTTSPFSSAKSYRTLDLATLSSLNATLFPGGISSKFNGFTGGVVVNGGTKLILVPWGNRLLEQANSVAMEYDNTRALNDPAAWTYIDLTTVNPKAAGYQFGWLDNNGFVWFVPTHNYEATSLPAVAPFIVYNTALPFNQASSWKTYANTGAPDGMGIWLTGAAYNPATNTAWMAGYGTPPTSTPAQISFNLELQEASAAIPTIAPDGVVNAAGYTAPVAPGSIASAFGSFLFTAALGDASLPVSTNLGGLSLQFAGGALAPLFFVSSGQANFQVPWELSGHSQISLTAAVTGGNSVGQNVNLAPFAPGIFSTNSLGTGQGDIFDMSNLLVDPSNPASQGSYVVIYCTGLGTVTNQPPTGSPAPGSPLAYTNTIPTVTIGGMPAQVQFSGLAPGFVGLYQVNAQVPVGSSTGPAVPVLISIGGVDSNAVTMAVR